MPASTALRAEGQLGELMAKRGQAEGTQGVYSPEASLAALEGILRAHAYLPGRKALVLFTAPSFRFSESRIDRMEAAIRPVLQLSQQGFVIWAVDVEGLGGRSGSSELISMLSHDSGGQTIRNTGELAKAFEGVREQQSCYYLISLPVDFAGETVRRAVTVALDTRSRPELFGLRVLSRTELAIFDRETQRTQRRIAALLSPDDFQRPPVAATLDYPSVLQGQQVLFARFRVPVSDLTWLPAADGSVTTRLMLDAVVQRDTGAGVEPVCEVGAEKTGALTLRLSRMPKPDPRVGFTVELPCAFKRDGLYAARGVVTDLEGEASGAGRSTVIFRTGGREEWAAMAMRVEAASGLDLVWRQGSGAARRDSGRSGFRVVTDDRPADFADRIALSYVLCGPDLAAARGHLRHVLLARAADGTRTAKTVFAPDKLDLAESGEKTGSFCAQVRIGVPSMTLEDGRYEFAVFEESADVSASLAPLAKGSPVAGLLGVTAFTVGGGT